MKVNEYKFKTTKEQRQLAKMGASFEVVWLSGKDEIFWGGRASGKAFGLEEFPLKMKEIELARSGLNDSEIEQEMIKILEELYKEWDEDEER